MFSGLEHERKHENIMDLFEELKILINTLNTANIDFALCGGLAMAIYAFPRSTLDIDILIPPEQLDKVKSIVYQLGYDFDAGLLEFCDGTIQIYRLNKTQQQPDDFVTLDLLLVTSEIREVWESRIQVNWEHGTIPVVSIEGMISLKSLRKSGQDQDDIKHLRRLQNEN